MVIVFDLDDTLYSEETFVLGGFKHVAEYAEEVWGFSSEVVNDELVSILFENGRGRVFDSWLARRGLYSVRTRNKLVSIYRSHDPQISIFPEAEKLLRTLRGKHSMHLVTDGNKLVQARKIGALGVESMLDGVYITHRFGLGAAKPSTYCFDLIRRREACSWSDMLYVGDNPHKDFVGLNPLGVNTVRVLTGPFKNVVVGPQAEASKRIENLQDLECYINSLEQSENRQV